MTWTASCARSATTSGSADGCPVRRLLPRCLSYDGAHMTLCESVFRSKNNLVNVAFCVSSSQIRHLLSGQLRSAVPLTFSGSAFSNHVCQVLGGGTEKQVRWPNAGRIVAPMADEPINGWRPINKSEDQSVRKNYTLRGTDPAIPSRVPRSRPLPATTLWALCEYAKIFGVAPETPIRLHGRSIPL